MKLALLFASLVTVTVTSLYGSFMPVQSKLVSIDEQHRRIELEVVLPSGDFDLGIFANYQTPGTVISNLDDDPQVGGFRLVFDDQRRPVFEVWQGTDWFRLVGSQAIARNSEVPVRLVRRSSQVRMEVFSSLLASGSCATPLSTAPLVAGDPTSGSPIGFTGQIRLDFARLAPPLPTSRLWDAGGVISDSAEARILGKLADYDARGVGMGLCVMSDDGEFGKRVSQWWGNDLRQVLPESSGMLIFGPKQAWIYSRTKDFNMTLATVDWVRESLDTTDGQPLELRIEAILDAGLQALGATPSRKEEPAKPTGEVAKRVGVAGGEVVGSQGVKVQVPAGALSRDVTFKVSQVGERVRIETDVPHLIFRQPIEVTLPSQAVKPVVAHFLDNETAVLEPIVRREGTSLVVRTNTLSDWMVFEEGRLTAAGVPAGAAAIGTGVIIVLKFSAMALVPAATAMVAVGYVGWLVGDAVHSISMMRNLDGPVPGIGFDVYWHGGSTPQYPAVHALYEKATGRLVLLSTAERGAARPESTIGPAGEAATTLTLEFAGRRQTYRVDQLESRLIPKAVLNVLGDLQYARTFYKNLGFTVPENTWVAIHPFLSATKAQGKEVNAGEWDGKVLSVNTTGLGTTTPLSDSVRATLAHEYWHAVSNAGFLETYPGKDESLATNMESAVLASTNKDEAGGLDFIKLRNWLSSGPVLRSGLQTVGPGEDRSKRGYDLWAWPKFILISKGPASYVQFVQDKVAPAQLATWWKEFALAVTLDDRRLESPSKFQVGGQVLYSLTNFSSGALFGGPRSAAFKYPTTETGLFEPFSLAWDGVLIPARPAAVGPCPIIVRRLMSHQPERYVGQDFLVGPLYDPRRLPEIMSTASTVQSTSRVVMPASGDTSIEERRLPIVIFPTDKALNLAEDSMLIYRLLPPLNLTARFTNQTTLDVVVPPAKGIGALLPMVHYQGYRLFLRRQDGKLHTVDLLYSYREGPVASKQALDPQTHRAVISIPWTRAEVADVGLATIDQGAPAGQPAVLSPIAWQGTEQPKGGATFVRAKAEARITLPGDEHTDRETVYEFVAKNRLSVGPDGKEKVVTIVGKYTIVWPPELKPTAAGNVFVGEAELRAETEPAAWVEVECGDFKQSLAKGSAILKLPIKGVVLDPRQGIQVEVRVNGVGSCYMRAWYKLPPKS